MGDLIDRIAVGQWTAPTPCTEWNVRDLVNHLVGMNLVFVAMFEESRMPERGADRLGADPAGADRRSAAALLRGRNASYCNGTQEIYGDHAVIVIDLVAAGLDRIPARRKGPM
jgi:uncharacterized protein (TIGR03083 family)